MDKPICQLCLVGKQHDKKNFKYYIQARNNFLFETFHFHNEYAKNK
jgi:hypothetical protein